jgi:thiol-disulfide isomerase/thioredoxin
MTSKRSIALALLLCVALPVVATAQDTALDNVLRDFERSGAYLLVVDGKPVTDAEIYENGTIPAVLVLSSAIPTPVVLRAGRKSIEAVSVLKVAKQSDGTVALHADAELMPIGQFKLVGASPTFTYGNHRVALDVKPPLLGLHKAAKLAQEDPHYARKAAEYQPNAAAIAALQSQPTPVTVKVFFGSWCPICKQKVPDLLAVEGALAGSNVTFEYLGLPEPPATWKDPEVLRLKVAAVPTAIVLVDGKAVGRLVNQDWNAPEVELARIVKNVAKKP